MRPLIPALVANLAAIALAAADDYPRHVRVSVQFIEVPHPVLTELLAAGNTSGNALHEKAYALTNDGTAKLLETCVVACKPGQKATIESIREFIYPTEYEPQQPPNSLPLSPSPKPPGKPFIRPSAWPAWETRNVGTTLEIEPNISEDGRIVDLRFVPEIVQLERLETFAEYVDQWGDASTRMPVFKTWRVNTSVVLVSGKFEMVGLLTPKPNAPGPVVLRKILVFVRADILHFPAQP